MEYEDAFNAFKPCLIEDTVLAIADPAIPYELHTDASGSGLGAALYQIHDGVLRPVAYVSRGLSISESRYPAHKLEFLALWWAVYLYGSTFRVITDNNPLTYVLRTAMLDATGHRWLAALAAYDFDISYRAGQFNIGADGLSRRPHVDEHETYPEQERNDRRIASLLRNTLPMRAEETPNSGEIVNATVEARHVPAVQCLPVTDSALLDGQVDEAVVHMPSLSVQEQRYAQLAGPAIARLRNLLEDPPTSPRTLRGETREVLTMLHDASHFYFQQDVLYKKSIISGQQVHMLVVPSALRNLVYQGMHEEVGHLGPDRGVSLARTRFHWHKMEEDIRAYCKRCVPCTLRNTPAPRAAEMSSTII